MKSLITRSSINLALNETTSLEERLVSRLRQTVSDQEYRQAVINWLEERPVGDSRRNARELTNYCRHVLTNYDQIRGPYQKEIGVKGMKKIGRAIDSVIIDTLALFFKNSQTRAVRAEKQLVNIQNKVKDLINLNGAQSEEIANQQAENARLRALLARAANALVEEDSNACLDILVDEV